MNLSLRTLFSLVAINSIAAMGSVSLAQKGEVPGPAPSNVIDTVVGEKLDPSNYGPGVVEGWEEAEERERNMPAGAVNPKMRNGQQGKWVIPKPAAIARTHSGARNVTNTWGDTKLGISFPNLVTVNGAYFAGQSSKSVWASAVKANGYRKGKLVASTDWADVIGEEPQWFEMNLKSVDRIEIESKPVLNGGGWYAMDDLTYTIEPAKRGKAAAVEPKVIDFEDTNWGQVLSGTEYAGVRWEVGTGDFDQAIPGPIRTWDENKPAPKELPPTGEVDGGDAGGGVDATTPTLQFNFQGPTMSGSFPPDTCGAVGLNHFVSVVNTNFSVWRKSDGFRLINQSLSSFFGGGSGDPRVLYDTHSGRWIVLDTDFSTRIFLAVSTSNDPTGTWFKTNFVAGSALDFPTLGVDEKGIYIEVWPTSGGTMTLFAIDKAPMIAPVPSMGTINSFTGLPHDQALQPAQTYGIPSPAGEYVISTQGSSALRLRRVTWSGTTAFLSTLTSVPVPSFSIPPDAPAMGSGTPLDTGDTRLVNSIFRNGFLWTTHTVNVSGRAGIRWYKINPANSTLVESGTISDPVRAYFYPSIAVNAANDVIMGFSGSSSTQFGAAYYSGRASTDAPGEMATPVLLRAGNASYSLIDSFGRNRWGDYSLTTVDPSDDNTMWTIQEYVQSTNLWGTQIGKLIVNAPPANNSCDSAGVVGAGSWPINTVFCTTDGFDEPGVCNFAGSSNIQNDVWYKILAQCTGTMTVSICAATFDTKLAAYPTSACPLGPGEAITCNDDSCGSGSVISFPVNSGTVYRIRIGSRTGATGTGTMVIACTPTPQCPADATNDGQVNVNDLLAVINAWGPCAGCPADVTNDGQVNVNDLLAVINAWGPC